MEVSVRGQGIGVAGEGLWAMRAFGSSNPDGSGQRFSQRAQVCLDSRYTHPPSMRPGDICKFASQTYIQSSFFFLSYGIFKCLVDVVCRLHTVVYSLLGWTTRGRHHTPVFRMFDWPLHRDFSLLFAIGEVGSFTCIGCDSPIHGTDGLESPPKDLAMRIERLAKGRYCRGGIWTHAEPPVWKFAVYTLALRPLGHDSSSNIYNTSSLWW